jgi:dihydrofolate reductase
MKVFMIAAQSADGFIGRDVHHRSLDWRSKEDAELFIRLTKETGVIVMGSKTFNTFRIRRAPPGRRLIIYTSRPEAMQGDGIETTSEEPRALVERLEREGATAVAIGGGASIYKLFMDSGLVDEVYLTIEPVLFGAGVPLFSGEVHARLSLIENRQLNDDTTLLRYAVKK